MKVEIAGMDGYGATPYCGTGCFHRRESLCGKVYSKDYRKEWNIEDKNNTNKTVNELEAASKILASCSFEKETQWRGKVSLFLSLSLSLFECLCVCVCMKLLILHMVIINLQMGLIYGCLSEDYNWLGYPM